MTYTGIQHLKKNKFKEILYLHDVTTNNKIIVSRYDAIIYVVFSILLAR